MCKQEGRGRVAIPFRMGKTFALAPDAQGRQGVTVMGITMRTQAKAPTALCTRCYLYTL